jgi:tetratricopeptide (TPR) repeat protein
MDTPEIDAQRLVGNWLQDEATGPWLMIVDNVDSEDVMCENNDGQSTVTKLLSCIPRVDNGSVLFTGRHRMTAMKLADEVVSLNELTEGEAIELLKRTLKNDNVSYEDAKALIDELGYIPLVINHAASFIRENDSDISSYLELYHENEEECIELLGGDVSDEHNSSSSDIPKSVLRTWSVSFNHLQKDPTAGRLPRVLLSIMSFMDRQEIPKSALYFFDKKGLKVHYEKAFGTLKNMSLITQSGDRTFSMHRLVQLSMRRWLKQQGTDRDFADKAVSLLAEAFPDGSLRTWKECSDLIVHAETVLSHAMDSTEPLARARLLSNVAAFQSNRGQYSAAEVKYEQVVKLKTQVQGPEHPETMDAIDLLALIMRREARYSEAEQLALQTLAVRERLFDREHVETLKSAQIIATLHGDRGNHKLAEEQNRSIWEVRQRILGSEHLDTLQSAANLSISLWELGKYSEAEKLAREVLTARENALGEESTETLEIADTLGFIVEVQGKYTQAEALKRHILEIRERVLGGDHPDTAGSLHDLAWILHQQGRYLEAGDYYDRAIQLKLKLLGEDHPTTLTTMCNVPVFLGDKGRYEEAENASRRILQKWEKIRGPEHPQTLDALGDYAVVLRHLGKLDAAAQAAQKSISGRERAFREDHPWTLPTVVQLGYILTLQGECSRGEKIIRTALTGLEKELGKDHPYVYTGMICLSKNLLIQKQKLEEAETLSRQALDGRKRILGTGHPYTFKTMYHHSLVLLAREQFLEAEAMCRCALDGMQTTLGSEHPDVTRCDKDYSRIIEQMALLQSPQMKIIGVGYIDLEGAEFN